MQGEQILTKTILPTQTSIRLDVSTLPKGIYLVKVVQGERYIGVEKVAVE